MFLLHRTRPPQALAGAAHTSTPSGEGAVLNIKRLVQPLRLFSTFNTNAQHARFTNTRAPARARANHNISLELSCRHAHFSQQTERRPFRPFFATHEQRTMTTRSREVKLREPAIAGRRGVQNYDKFVVNTLAACAQEQATQRSTSTVVRLILHTQLQAESESGYPYAPIDIPVRFKHPGRATILVYVLKKTYEQATARASTTSTTQTHSRSSATTFKPTRARGRARKIIVFKSTENGPGAR